MKKTMVLMMGLGCVFSGNGQLVITKHAPGPNILNSGDATPLPTATVPDPVRILDGQLVHVDGSWIAVSGTVMQSMPGKGVRVQGMLDGQYQDTDFWLVDLPFDIAEGEVLPPPGEVVLVKPSGIYTYTTTMNAPRTIRKYDYGLPTTEPPKSPEEIAKENADLRARKKASKEAALKSNEDAAAKNDPYGLMRMGERYRDGEGVETNLMLARVYLQRAALGGMDDATNELAKMPVISKTK